MKQQLERIFMPKKKRKDKKLAAPQPPRKLPGMTIKGKKPTSGRGKKPEKQLIDLFSKGAK